MSSILKLTLTAEMQAFVEENSGDGTPFPTPSDFVIEVLREKKERCETAAIREAVLAGLNDATAGRMHLFQGDLRTLMNKVG